MSITAYGRVADVLPRVLNIVLVPEFKLWKHWAWFVFLPGNIQKSIIHSLLLPILVSYCKYSNLLFHNSAVVMRLLFTVLKTFSTFICPILIYSVLFSTNNSVHEFAFKAGITGSNFKGNNTTNDIA